MPAENDPTNTGFLLAHNDTKGVFTGTTVDMLTSRIPSEALTRDQYMRLGGIPTISTTVTAGLEEHEPMDVQDSLRRRPGVEVPTEGYGVMDISLE